MKTKTIQNHMNIKQITVPHEYRNRFLKNVGSGGGSNTTNINNEYATQSWINNNFITKDYFRSLFRAYFDSNEVLPNNNTGAEINNIKALHGFWSEAYISALGQNSAGGSGGTGGASSLSELTDVTLTSPLENGQVLTYNGTSWVNGTGGGGGTGTITSVAMTVPLGFSISGSPITSSGTLALSFAEGYSLPTTAKQNQWDTAYGWGDHSQAGYAYASDVFTKTEANGRFITIDYFRSLFKAYDSNGNEVMPNTTTGIDNIKAMFGFWTDAYISALGQNSAGGGTGGASSLSELTDVLLSSPVNGDILKFNGYKWVNESGYATQFWVENQGYVTSTAISDMATKTWVGNQGYLTSSAISDMATKTWVGQQGFLTSSAISDMATKTWVGEQGFAYASDVYDKTTADSRFITVAFFDRLFKAYNGTTQVAANNTTSTIDNIKAMFGFWTEQYISALGQNSGGSGGGGSWTLSGLTDVNISSPANGQGLVYNSSTSKWVNTNLNIHTHDNKSVLDGITSTYVSHWNTAYTNSHTHSNKSVLDGITSTNVSNWNTAYTNNHTHSNKSVLDGITSTKVSTWDDAVTKSNVSVLVGAGASNQGQIQKSVSSQFIKGRDNSIIKQTNNAGTDTFCAIATSLTGSGDWSIGTYFETLCAIYTSNTKYSNNTNSPIIFTFPHSDNNGAPTESGTLAYINSSNQLKIGGGMITWDATNNAFKISKTDGTSANLYALGGISALGFGTGTNSISVSELTVNKLNINNGNNYINLNGNYLNVYGNSGIKFNDNVTISPVGYIDNVPYLRIKNSTYTLLIANASTSSYSVTIGAANHTPNIYIYNGSTRYKLDMSAAINAGILTTA